MVSVEKELGAEVQISGIQLWEPHPSQCGRRTIDETVAICTTEQTTRNKRASIQIGEREPHSVCLTDDAIETARHLRRRRYESPA